MDGSSASAAAKQRWLFLKVNSENYLFVLLKRFLKSYVKTAACLLLCERRVVYFLSMLCYGQCFISLVLNTVARSLAGVPTNKYVQCFYFSEPKVL